MGCDSYKTKKQKLTEHLKSVLGQSGSVGLIKDTSNLFRNRNQTNKLGIDLREFNQVISIDVERKVAVVEGLVTYEQLVDATLEHNLLPTVVPELKTITIGGAFTGVGIESSSFKYGLVHETIISAEILLSNGEVVFCDKDNNSDLFYCFPNSYGTLGYALQVSVGLINIKPYIQLTNETFSNKTDFCEAIEGYALNKPKHIDYLDGVIFNESEMVITKARFVDNAPKLSNYRYMKIFYKSLLKKKTDYLTIKDYIWRWDTDWFWCSRFFGMQNPILRLILGKWILNSKSFWKIRKLVNTNPWLSRIIEKLTGPQESVIQDVEIPINNSGKFIDFFFKHIPIRPIWVCPVKPLSSDQYFPLYTLDSNKLYLNFGFWQGVPSKQPDGFYNRKIEKCVQDLDGHKSLYSNSYYSKAKFWSIFDKHTYQTIKSKYDPNNQFSDLYTKCVLKK